MPLGTSTSIYGQIEEVVLRCVSFHDAASLAALFVDPRLSRWQDDIPVLTSKSRRQLIRGIIAFLARQSNAQGRNGLVLLLEVLHDQTSPGDRCRQELANMLTRLKSTPAEEMRVAAEEARLFANVPYAMEAGFTGRERELQVLDEWLREDGDHSMMVLLSLGGTGKSALSWHWCNTLRKAEKVPLQAIFWWNVAEEVNIAAFLADALRFFGDSPDEYGQARGQLRRLLQHWQQAKTLVVLDGAERLLQAYRGLGAIYEEEIAAQADENARRCADPVAGEFLVWLAQGHGGTKTLITSRLMPQELEGPGGFSLQGVRQLDLMGLDPEEALSLFRSLGVQSTMAEVKAVAGPLAYHPLSLRLLAGYVTHEPDNRNSLSAAVNYAQTATLKERQAKILKSSFTRLPTDAQHLLSRLAAFRGGVTWQTMKAVFADDSAQTREQKSGLQHLVERRRIISQATTAEDRGLSTSSLQQMALLLEKRGLLQRTTQDGSDLFDLHPIVRQYAYDQLLNPRALHAYLADYFDAISTPHSVDSAKDLLPTIELYHHLIQAGELSKAFRLYVDRLHYLLYYRFGEYVLALQLLAAIPRSSSGFPQLESSEDQTWNLLYACLCHERMGQLEEGLAVAEKAVHLNRQIEDPISLASALAPYAMVCAEEGQLQEADEAIRESAEIFDKIGIRNWQGISHRSRGRVLMIRGQYDEADREFALAATIYGDSHRYRQGRIVLMLYRAQWHLATGNPATALELARQAATLGSTGEFKQEWVDALRVKAKALMAAANSGASGEERMMEEAGDLLERALAEARRVNLLELEVRILPEQATWHLVQGNPIMATSYALEALEILEPTAYRLIKADINNILARIAHRRGDNGEAREYATIARSLSWCSGSPFAYMAGLEAAEQTLRTIAADETGGTHLENGEAKDIAAT